ncbi:MAG TPA: hypothetical protein VKN18_27195 [Blastocatellia bacterium]|nr:hypothetical protein [Blastocatellia bacterium]
MRILSAMFLVLCLVFAIPSSGRSAAANRTDEHSEAFSALAQLPTAGVTMNVRIFLNGYSTEQEAQQLHGLLLDGGPKAVLKALQKMKSKGRIEPEGSISFYDFKFILSKKTPNGRHIYAVADRPISFLEKYFSTRSTDYPFGILELDLTQRENGKEKGEGTLIYAAKVKVLDGEKVDIENLTFAPIKLLGVRQL